MLPAFGTYHVSFRDDGLEVALKKPKIVERSSLLNGSP
jgi:hypothetical protein